ncbi:MAG: acyl--CoA ligase, partial [Candidatus Sericytochromatia bacterium]|nr:acyl--CoA ligase [Candidatus Tanganyikabacteria bacterium]
AGDLLAAGGGPGRVVAVAVREPGPALIAMLAVLEAGATLAPIDVRVGSAGRTAAESRARPICTVRDASLEGEIEIAPAPPAEPRHITPEAGLILFTSGSSGEPKGVVLPRAGIAANVDAILSYLPVPAFPVTACVLPLSYSYALVGQCFVTLRAGGTLLLLGDVPFPARQVELMREAGATGLSSVPTSLRLLADAAADFPPPGRPRLGYVASAGAALDAITRSRLTAAFPEARLFSQYGLTEASPRVAAISAADPAFAAGSVGMPLPGIAVHAAGERGEALPPGEVGELLVRAPSVMLGYLDDPEGTARVLGPDGLRTGDYGWVDDRGYIYVQGRRDDVVKCGGERVSLEEVAGVIRGAPGVEDACVVALPDDRLGMRLVAFVAGEDGIAGRVQDLLRAWLPPAKRPSRIVGLPALPRSLNGKLDVALLRELAGEQAEAC